MSVALLNEKAIMPDRDYYEIVQARKRLPNGLQEALNNAFAKIPVSFFPEVPGGKVIEIPADTSIADAVQILSEHNILSAPVRNPEADDNTVWYDRYLGMLDYSAIIFWVLENAELAAVALAAGSATAAGMGVGAVGALGAIALGTTGPAAVAGLTIAAFGAAVAGGLVVDKHVGKDAPAAADYLGEDFYKVILQEEPFKSTTVICIDGKEPVLEAFKRMNEKQIGGLPVVQGPTNKIIGNISMRDIRFLLLHQELFSRFRQLTAVDFMRTVASTTGSSVMMPPITCTYGTSLGDVIEILSTKCIHRVHLVDEQDVVLGVITLRDVISCFVSEPERYFENYFGFFSSESR
uniref:CBS domain-containing protein n=1 Tax=Araucaria cunninghamii TaxID=56994 RepID=A0A0D6R3K9_ARACU